MKITKLCVNVAHMTPIATGRYIIHTFGCQMNMHDSDRMEEVLRSDGWQPTDHVEQADLVIFNTCSVREKAEQKLRSEVGKLVPAKEYNPGLIIAVAGCVAQQEGENLLKQIKLIDLLVGPDNIVELPLLLRQQLGGAPPQARTVFDLEHPQFLQSCPQPGQIPVSAFVTTMKGCDERCSFCVVPYTRGPERYRPATEILDEIARLVDLGAKEIVLLGQTVDSYKDPSLPPPESEHPDESQFPQLLRMIADRIPKLLRLRYTSPHPRHATFSLAKAHAELPVLAKHIHLPVQSGSNRILKRMIRRYTKEEYVERANRLKTTQPGLTLSTDIIVGFPGETEEDFQATLSLIKEIGFTSVYGFKYSVRPHTPARKMIDDVPAEIKNERLQRLFALTEDQGHRHLLSLLGTQQSVLVESRSKYEVNPRDQRIDHEFFQGRTDKNEIVHIECPKGYSLIGHVTSVDIVKANKHSLMGQLTHGMLQSLVNLRIESLPPQNPKLPRLLPILPPSISP